MRQQKFCNVAEKAKAFVNVVYVYR